MTLGELAELIKYKIHLYGADTRIGQELFLMNGTRFQEQTISLDMILIDKDDMTHSETVEKPVLLIGVGVERGH